MTAGDNLYRAVWRFHAWAGIIVAPFVVFLAITGSIYLWKPQYEEWRYAHLLRISEEAAPTVSADAQFAAARARHPEARPVTFTPAFTSNRTSETVFALPDGDNLSVFVSPATGQVLGERRESERLMMTIHRLHGTLLAGTPGRLLVELAASWALVLFLTGIYLWWPREPFSVWGFLLPRLRSHGRVFWRDLHAVPAVWLSLATIFLLSTGLLWTTVAGGWYRAISAAFGEGTPRESEAGVHRSELTGWSPPLQTGLAERIDALSSEFPLATQTHLHHHSASGGGALSADFGLAANAISLERVLAIARERAVPEPFTIAFPVAPTGVFSILSDREQPFTRAYVHLDQYSGEVLADVRFQDFGVMAKFFLWGIIAHEGRLFGLANQIVGTCAALGVILLAGSGTVMWWQRRPAARATQRGDARLIRLPRSVLIGSAVLMLLLPLLALTFVPLLLIDGCWAAVRGPRGHVA